MNPDDLCMGCMGHRGALGTCPSCGWEEGREPDSPLHLPPRTVLDGTYLLGRVLGQGGFAVTYLAWDLNLNRKLAIKEYLPAELASRSAARATVTPFTGPARDDFEHGLTSFQREGQILAQFHTHPNIVPVLGFFRENGTGYLVMSFVEGRDFESHLREHGGRIPFDAAMTHLLQVMDALKAVHEANVLHRDVSPDNIYVEASGQVRLLDFGAARASLLDKSKSIILKHGYAPEEQYRSRGHQGPWTDVYATAATLYRALTGDRPPDALERVARDEIEPPSRRGASLPPAAEQALLKALAVRAADRFQTIRELQDALRRAQPPAATRPSDAHRPARGSPLTFFLIAGGVVAAVAGVVVAGLLVAAIALSPAPAITKVDFPAAIPTGQWVNGAVYFRDRPGDVARALLEFPGAPQLRGSEWDPRVSGQDSGSFAIRIGMTAPGRYRVRLILTDASGHQSLPHEFSVEAVPPGRMP